MDARYTMADLPSLPFEIHSMVLDYCDFKAVRSYALIAKAATPPANRPLYRELHLGPTGHVTKWTCDTIQHLLRSLTQRPHLASLMKSVHLDLDYTCNFSEETRYLEEFSVGRAGSDFSSLGKDIVEELGLPNPRSWDIELRHTFLDPWIALLLAQFRSMEILKLGPTLLQKSTFLGSSFST